VQGSSASSAPHFAEKSGALQEVAQTSVHERYSPTAAGVAEAPFAEH